MKKIGWQIWLLIGIVLIGALAGANALGWIGGTKGIEVEVAKAERRTLVAKVQNSGVIQPELEVPISPDVSGEVVSVHVKEGDFVRKGQLIFTIRPDNLRSSFEQSQASLNSAQADYANARAALVVSESNRAQDSINLARNTPLFQQKVISQQDFENYRLKFRISSAQVEQNRQQMQAAYYRIQSAKASNRQAADNLSRTSVYASMTGIVTKMDAKVGQRAVGVGMMAGTEVAKVADLTRMEVLVDVNENDIVAVKIGDTASVEVDAYPNKHFTGRVTEIAYTANVASTGNVDQITNYQVSILIEPSSYLKDAEVMRGRDPRIQSPFRPGMSAVVNIFTQRADNVVSVPQAAVTIERSENRAEADAPAGPAAPGGQRQATATLANVRRQELVFVYDSIKSQVNVRRVTSGLSDDNFIEIKEGIQAGESIVRGPFQAVSKLLKDGSPVKIKQQKVAKKGNKKPDAPKP